MANEQERKDLLKRIEWAFQNRDKISSFITVHKSSFDVIMHGFRKGYGHHIHNHEQIVKIFDSLNIPLAEEINSGFDINNMQIRGQAFADTAYQLKASVECSPVVEAKIQDTLQQYEISMEWDRYNVSGHGNIWIAIIHRVNSYEDDIENLIEGGRDMIESYKKLYQKAADGTIWIGFGSPEVALASAMVDFRRDQLRQLGLHA